MDEARLFASENNLTLVPERDSKYALQFIYGENIVELFDTELNTSIFVDFVKGALAHRQQLFT